MSIPDMSRFTSRWHYRGHLVFNSAHRIGAERSLAVDLPDLPVLRTAGGQPYIPGSSFKGAWRSYTEAILRAWQEQPDIQEKNLACLVIGKPARRPQPDPEQGRCLTQDEVAKHKREIKQPTELDNLLREKSCFACRVFGNSWLASKVLVKDFYLNEQRTPIWQAEVRDGVAIDRDALRAADGQKYQFEAIASGVVFDVEIIIENASPEELGLVMLGLEAFARGDILLGGARSRGLGWCQLEHDWERSRYVEATQIFSYLLGDHNEVKQTGQTQYPTWLKSLRQALLPIEA